MSKLNQVINSLDAFNTDQDVADLILNLRTLSGLESYPSNDFIDELKNQVNYVIDTNSSSKNGSELTKAVLQVSEILSEFEPETESTSAFGMQRYGLFPAVSLDIKQLKQILGSNETDTLNIGFGPQKVAELSDILHKASSCHIKL